MDLANIEQRAVLKFSPLQKTLASIYAVMSENIKWHRNVKLLIVLPQKLFNRIFY